MNAFLASLDYSALPKDKRILVACSGGGDSMALLHALRDAEYSLVAAHVNHGTRGQNSDDDEEFVREHCLKNSIEFCSERVKFDSPNPTEAQMREARYAALQRLAKEYSIVRIATGHTGNDVLETVLMNWLRGGGVQGLAGIPAKRELASGVLLARPLLGATRGSAREFLLAKNQPWREDDSNQSDEYFRNRVRNELVPFLADFSKKSPEQLALQTVQTAKILRDDLELLDKQAEDAIRTLAISGGPDVLALDGREFVEILPALQRRVLRAGALRMSTAARDVEFEKIETAREAIVTNARRAVWQWRADLRVEWTGEHSGQRIRFLRVQS